MLKSVIACMKSYVICECTTFSSDFSLKKIPATPDNAGLYLGYSGFEAGDSSWHVQIT